MGERSREEWWRNVGGGEWERSGGRTWSKRRFVQTSELTKLQKLNTGKMI